LDTIENDMRAVGVYVGDMEDRDKWRFRTMVADPKCLEKRRRRRRNTLGKTMTIGTTNNHIH